jgi:hypothetical protein
MLPRVIVHLSRALLTPTEEMNRGSTFQLISQMTKLGVENPSWRHAANAMGPSGQCGATPISYVLLNGSNLSKHVAH